MDDGEGEFDLAAAQQAEAAEAAEEAERAAAAEAAAAPPGGLDPVLESTERSAFSMTNPLTEGADWSNGNPSPSESPTDSGQLGTNPNLGSVKVGFFDGSKLSTLGDSSDAGTPRAELPEGESDLREMYEQAMSEVARLRENLASTEAAKQDQERVASANMKRVLDANTALQAQLRELNGVIERVVQKELRTSRGDGKASGPRSVFPIARPGARGQKKSPAPAGRPQPGRGVFK